MNPPDSKVTKVLMHHKTCIGDKVRIKLAPNALCQGHGFHCVNEQDFNGRAMPFLGIQISGANLDALSPRRNSYCVLLEKAGAGFYGAAECCSLYDFIHVRLPNEAI